jgi:hypothetical protein
LVSQGKVNTRKSLFQNQKVQSGKIPFRTGNTAC